MFLQGQSTVTGEVSGGAAGAALEIKSTTGFTNFKTKK
jgi:hypothetical protein